MVTSRRPAHRRATDDSRRETLEEKFLRLSAQPVGSPIPRLTKREAHYFLTRLAGSNPKARPGVDVVRDVRGDWGERMDLIARKR